MAEMLFVEYSIEGEQWDIVDTFKDLNSYWQAIKEWLADNWVAIALSLIPMWAWFVAVWMASKSISWAMRWKTLANYWNKVRFAWNSLKWVTFYEWMNLTNNALYQDKFSADLLSWSLDSKELIKNALFFNIMWIANKWIKPWEVFTKENALWITKEILAFTWVDLWVELIYNEKMSSEQFLNSLLTWGILTIMSRWAIKIPKIGKVKDIKIKDKFEKWLKLWNNIVKEISNKLKWKAKAWFENGYNSVLNKFKTGTEFLKDLTYRWFKWEIKITRKDLSWGISIWGVVYTSGEEIWDTLSSLVDPEKDIFSLENWKNLGVILGELWMFKELGLIRAVVYDWIVGEIIKYIDKS
jgi:hypothetical protein